MVVPPGDMVPHGMELKGVLHPLSEYTAKFADVDTAPLDDTFLVELMAAKVVSVNAIAIMTNAVTAVVTESFIFAVFFPSQNYLCIKS